MKIKNTYSAEETELLGYELGLLLKDERKVVILLDGELGAGKTTFTKGIAKGIGITQIVNSPTFTIMKKYLSADRMKTMYHLDLYRLDHVGNDFDLEEYIDGLGIIVVEWPFKVEEFLPTDYLLVKIEKISDTERKFIMQCEGIPCKRAVQFI
ncbi:MAG: tRNA (adenosine(37)-N6)-threonylcarbamoyltransferase complex ATPase subunit type 1 TsaE [Tenericutes bacterium GWE2_38_8]|jgi:tRNA threonylcarbamoyladenosine biosynthesis protein TsaE|nr:MAG: tRNA (adenosine(37)-N6)-threonylcarbamoyltransferase complex ATPase subunit type 1 TsaE [Tenericutes bacterium GWD2_38_27]OHE39364.1 MAG: tRNA (adenosine(37)-N6)-threonylcarbamoyltransferase complex ATPase subunit type 1 TsaE [Tenericutes bacterium GWE2_38_8]OHE45616.1 MAG: tRNA (adenosine(37)-N6)-threonylcarbamoyltransferase complex ATPase subunit type 1 TsaE [Tenericutes bacterium GWF2_38_8]HBG33364.1 tRNA (adenosine(37)-N6)-threonylcarbamoyltransferase complex ATPase subunit type 1 Ts